MKRVEKIEAWSASIPAINKQREELVPYLAKCFSLPESKVNRIWWEVVGWQAELVPEIVKYLFEKLIHAGGRIDYAAMEEFESEAE